MSESTARAIREIIDECLIPSSVLEKAEPKSPAQIHTIKPIKSMTTWPAAKWFTTILVRKYAGHMTLEGDYGLKSGGFAAFCVWRLPLPVGMRDLPDEVAFRISTWNTFNTFKKLSHLPVKVMQNGAVMIGEEIIGIEEVGTVNPHTLFDAKALGIVRIAPGLNIAERSAGTLRPMDFYLWFATVSGGRMGIVSSDSRRLHIQFDNIKVEDAELATASIPAWLDIKSEVTLFKCADGKHAASYGNVIAYYDSLAGSFPPAEKVIPKEHNAEIDLSAAIDGLKLMAERGFAPSHKTVIRPDGAVVGKAGAVGRAKVPDGFGGLGFNASYVLDAISFSGTSTFRCMSNGTLNPFTFGTDRLAVVMPIMIKSTDVNPSDQASDPAPATPAE